MGATKLPKDIRKSLNKLVPLSGPAGVVNLILRPYIRARRAKKILMDPSRDLENSVREEVERIYVTSFAEAIGVGASTLLVVTIVTTTGPTIPKDFLKAFPWLVVAGYLGLYALLFYAAKWLSIQLLRLKELDPASRVKGRV